MDLIEITLRFPTLPLGLAFKRRSSTPVVPDDGVLNLAVSGYPDFDFDGRDDRSGYPHGESGDYDLVLIV